MGFWGRLRLVFQTQAERAVAALEDPKKSLDFSLVRLEDNLRQARQSLVAIVGSQRLLESRRDQAGAAAAHHELQARQALASGRDDLAHLALERRQAALARRAELEVAAANLEGQAESLKVTLLGLQTRIEIFRSRKEELNAIYDSSRAQIKVREAITGLSADLDDVGRTVRRAEGHIRRMQARAEAIDHLAATGAIVDALAPAGDDIDQELARLGHANNVEAELARLKQEARAGYIAAGPSQPALAEHAGSLATAAQGRLPGSENGAAQP
jgi:phage shock protein A